MYPSVHQKVLEEPNSALFNSADFWTEHCSVECGSRSDQQIDMTKRHQNSLNNQQLLAADSVVNYEHSRSSKCGAESHDVSELGFLLSSSDKMWNPRTLGPPLFPQQEIGSFSNIQSEPLEPTVPSVTVGGSHHGGIFSSWRLMETGSRPRAPGLRPPPLIIYGSSHPPDSHQNCKKMRHVIELSKCGADKISLQSEGEDVTLSSCQLPSQAFRKKLGECLTMAENSAHEGSNQTANVSLESVVENQSADEKSLSPFEINCNLGLSDEINFSSPDSPGKSNVATATISKESLNSCFTKIFQESYGSTDISTASRKQDFCLTASHYTNENHINFSCIDGSLIESSMFDCTENKVKRPFVEGENNLGSFTCTSDIFTTSHDFHNYPGHNCPTLNTLKTTAYSSVKDFSDSSALSELLHNCESVDALQKSRTILTSLLSEKEEAVSTFKETISSVKSSVTLNIENKSVPSHGAAGMVEALNNSDRQPLNCQELTQSHSDLSMTSQTAPDWKHQDNVNRNSNDAKVQENASKSKVYVICWCRCQEPVPANTPSSCVDDKTVQNFCQKCWRKLSNDWLKKKCKKRAIGFSASKKKTRNQNPLQIWCHCQQPESNIPAGSVAEMCKKCNKRLSKKWKRLTYFKWCRCHTPVLSNGVPEEHGSFGLNNILYYCKKCGKRVSKDREEFGIKGDLITPPSDQMTLPPMGPQQVMGDHSYSQSPFSAYTVQKISQVHASDSGSKTFNQYMLQQQSLEVGPDLLGPDKSFSSLNPQVVYVFPPGPVHLNGNYRGEMRSLLTKPLVTSLGQSFNLQIEGSVEAPSDSELCIKSSCNTAPPIKPLHASSTSSSSSQLDLLSSCSHVLKPQENIDDQSKFYLFEPAIISSKINVFRAKKSLHPHFQYGILDMIKPCYVMLENIDKELYNNDPSISVQECSSTCRQLALNTLCKSGELDRCDFSLSSELNPMEDNTRYPICNNKRGFVINDKSHWAVEGCPKLKPFNETETVRPEMQMVERRENNNLMAPDDGRIRLRINHGKITYLSFSEPKHVAEDQSHYQTIPTSENSEILSSLLTKPSLAYNKGEKNPQSVGSTFGLSHKRQVNSQHKASNKKKCADKKEKGCLRWTKLSQFDVKYYLFQGNNRAFFVPFFKKKNCKKQSKIKSLDEEDYRYVQAAVQKLLQKEYSCARHLQFPECLQHKGTCKMVTQTGNANATLSKKSFVAPTFGEELDMESLIELVHNRDFSRLVQKTSRMSQSTYVQCIGEKLAAYLGLDQPTQWIRNVARKMVIKKSNERKAQQDVSKKKNKEKLVPTKNIAIEMDYAQEEDLLDVGIDSPNCVLEERQCKTFFDEASLDTVFYQPGSFVCNNGFSPTEKKPLFNELSLMKQSSSVMLSNNSVPDVELQVMLPLPDMYPLRPVPEHNLVGLAAGFSLDHTTKMQYDSHDITDTKPLLGKLLAASVFPDMNTGGHLQQPQIPDMINTLPQSDQPCILNRVIKLEPPDNDYANTWHEGTETPEHSVCKMADIPFISLSTFGKEAVQIEDDSGIVNSDGREATGQDLPVTVSVKMEPQDISLQIPVLNCQASKETEVLLKQSHCAESGNDLTSFIENSISSLEKKAVFLQTQSTWNSEEPFLKIGAVVSGDEAAMFTNESYNFKMGSNSELLFSFCPGTEVLTDNSLNSTFKKGHDLRSVDISQTYSETDESYSTRKHCAENNAFEENVLNPCPHLHENDSLEPHQYPTDKFLASLHDTKNFFETVAVKSYCVDGDRSLQHICVPCVLPNDMLLHSSQMVHASVEGVDLSIVKQEPVEFDEQSVCSFQQTENNIDSLSNVDQTNCKDNLVAVVDCHELTDRNDLFSMNNKYPSQNICRDEQSTTEVYNNKCLANTVSEETITTTQNQRKAVKPKSRRKKYPYPFSSDRKRQRKRTKLSAENDITVLLPTDTASPEQPLNTFVPEPLIAASTNSICNEADANLLQFTDVRVCNKSSKEETQNLYTVVTDQAGLLSNNLPKLITSVTQKHSSDAKHIISVFLGSDTVLENDLPSLIHKKGMSSDETDQENDHLTSVALNARGSNVPLTKTHLNSFTEHLPMVPVLSSKHCDEKSESEKSTYSSNDASLPAEHVLVSLTSTKKQSSGKKCTKTKYFHNDLPTVSNENHHHSTESKIATEHSDEMTPEESDHLLDSAGNLDRFLALEVHTVNSVTDQTLKNLKHRKRCLRSRSGQKNIKKCLLSSVFRSTKDVGHSQPGQEQMCDNLVSQTVTSSIDTDNPKITLRIMRANSKVSFLPSEVRNGKNNDKQSVDASLHKERIVSEHKTADIMDNIAESSSSQLNLAVAEDTFPLFFQPSILTVPESSETCQDVEIHQMATEKPTTDAAIQNKSSAKRRRRGPRLNFRKKNSRSQKGFLSTSSSKPLYTICKQQISQVDNLSNFSSEQVTVVQSHLLKNESKEVQCQASYQTEIVPYIKNTDGLLQPSVNSEARAADNCRSSVIHEERSLFSHFNDVFCNTLTCTPNATSIPSVLVESSVSVTASSSVPLPFSFPQAVKVPCLTASIANCEKSSVHTPLEDLSEESLKAAGLYVTVDSKLLTRKEESYNYSTDQSGLPEQTLSVTNKSDVDALFSSDEESPQGIVKGVAKADGIWDREGIFSRLNFLSTETANKMSADSSVSQLKKNSPTSLLQTQLTETFSDVNRRPDTAELLSRLKTSLSCVLPSVKTSVKNKVFDEAEELRCATVIDTHTLQSSEQYVNVVKQPFPEPLFIDDGNKGILSAEEEALINVYRAEAHSAKTIIMRKRAQLSRHNEDKTVIQQVHLPRVTRKAARKSRKKLLADKSSSIPVHFTDSNPDSPFVSTKVLFSICTEPHELALNKCSADNLSKIVEERESNTDKRLIRILGGRKDKDYLSVLQQSGTNVISQSNSIVLPETSTSNENCKSDVSFTHDSHSSKQAGDLEKARSFFDCLPQELTYAWK